MIKHIVTAGLVSLAASNALADWQLNPAQSSLTATSVKAGKVVEYHEFKHLTGTLKEDGMVEVVLDLASIETGIPLRNERMQSLFFNVADYPTATFAAQVDLEKLQASDAPVAVNVPGALTLNGVTKPLTLALIVSHSKEQGYLVTTARPVSISVEEFGLLEGLNKLVDVAKLSGITPVVPVSFAVSFQ